MNKQCEDAIVSPAADHWILDIGGDQHQFPTRSAAEAAAWSYQARLKSPKPYVVRGHHVFYVAAAGKWWWLHAPGDRPYDPWDSFLCDPWVTITATDSGEYDVWKLSQQHRYSYPTLDAAMDAAIALLPTEDLPMIYPTGRIVDGREEYTFGVLGGTALPTTAIAAPLRDEGRSLWRYGRPVSIDGNGMATDGTIIMCAPLPVDGDILTVNGGKCSLRRGTAIVRPVCDAPTGMAVGVYVRSRGEWMPWSSPFEFEFAGRRFLADYNPQGASWKPLGVSYTANAACNSLLGALRGPDGWETVWLGGEPVVTADSEGVRYTLQRHASQPGCVDYFGVVAPLYAIEVSHEN